MERLAPLDAGQRQLLARSARVIREANALHEMQLQAMRQRRAATGAAHPFLWASFMLVRPE